MLTIDTASLADACSGLRAIRVALVLLRQNDAILVYLSPLETSVLCSQVLLVMRLSQHLLHVLSLLLRLGTFVAQAFRS